MDERRPANGAVAPVIRTGDAPGRRNLRPPWKKGESGNPRGRPSHRQAFEAAFHRAVAERAGELVKALLDAALGGDPAALRLVVERCVRRPEHVLDDGEQAQPTRLEVVFVNPDGAEG